MLSEQSSWDRSGAVATVARANRPRELFIQLKTPLVMEAKEQKLRELAEAIVREVTSEWPR